MTEIRQHHAWSIVLVLVVLTIGSSHASERHAVHLVNGHWFDGTDFVPREFYAVEGVLRSTYEGESATVNLGGGWVLPGYGNAHTHAIGNGRFDAESRRFLEGGVFYVANPNSLGSLSAEARELTRTPDTVDAVFANGGLTGPGGHPIQIFESEPHGSLRAGDAYFTIADTSDLEQTWPTIHAGQPDFLKIYLEGSEHHAERRSDPAYYGRRGLDPELVPAIVELAHSAGLRVAAHVTTRYDFTTAVAAGVDEIAHLPLEALQPRDAELAADRGTVLVTTVLSHRPSHWVEDLDALHHHNLRLLREAGVELVLGTDSQASVVDEVLKLESLGVFTGSELLTMLVQTTPQWIFPDRRIGRLEPGAEASFVVLAANPFQDLTHLREVKIRVKSGHLIPIESSAGGSLPGIGQQLVHTIMSRGVEETVVEYHRLRSTEPDAWDFSEGQLDALGDALIRHGKALEAVAIFELNCRQFPESPTAWSSLSEAQATAGDLSGAAESERRAAELAGHTASRSHGSPSPPPEKP